MSKKRDTSKKDSKLKKNAAKETRVQTARHGNILQGNIRNMRREEGAKTAQQYYRSMPLPSSYLRDLFANYT